MNELREPYLLLPQKAESLHQPVDWSGFIESWNTNVMQPLAKAFQSIAEILQPAFKPVVEVMGKINKIVWNAYLADGAIYGETQEGFLRWLKEGSKIERLQREAEQIEQRQANIRDFKEMLARKRAKQS